MNNKVSIYVPSLKKDGGRLFNRAHTVREVEDLMSVMFGGCTSYDVQGAYRLPDGSIQHERIKIVYAFTDKLNRATLKKVREYCISLKSRLQQDSIALEVNGNLYLM